MHDFYISRLSCYLIYDLLPFELNCRKKKRGNVCIHGPPLVFLVYQISFCSFQVVAHQNSELDPSLKKCFVHHERGSLLLILYCFEKVLFFLLL